MHGNVQTEQSEVAGSRDLRVLMVSLDPGLATMHSGGGDVLARHKAYARCVRSLDIVVLGGVFQTTPVYHHENLSVYAAGGKNLAGLLKAIRLAGEVIKKNDISLIVTQDPHATGWIGRKLARRNHIPLIVHLHGDFLDNRHWVSESWKNRLYAAIQEPILRNANGIRVVSNGIYEKLISHKLPPDKIAVINTPINDTLFRQLTDRQKLTIEKLRFKYGNKRILLFCGRLVMAKNIPFMLDIIQRLKAQRNDFLLLMVGEGEDRKLIQADLQKRKIDDIVFLLGSKKHAELVIYYRLADVLLLLSTNESFGKVIIEAGLCETPCLASATTGATSIVQEGRTGFIVPINDAEATVEVANEMLDYPEQTKMMGRWAREDYIEKYASEKTIRSIIEFWVSVVKRSQ